MIDVVDRRSHGAQLARLRRFYDPERILVLQFERCRRDPLGQYRRTLEFLEVRDRDFAPRRLRRKAAGKPESLLVAALLRLGLPEGTKRRVAERLAGRPVGRAAAPLWPDLEAALHTALDPDVAALRELVPELDLSLWPNFAHLADDAAPLRCAERRRSWQARPVPVPVLVVRAATSRRRAGMERDGVWSQAAGLRRRGAGGAPNVRRTCSSVAAMQFVRRLAGRLPGQPASRRGAVEPGPALQRVAQSRRVLGDVGVKRREQRDGAAHEVDDHVA